MDIKKRSREVEFRAHSGWPFLIGLPAALVALVACFALLAPAHPWILVPGAPAGLAALISLGGFFVVSPNTSRVLVLFGRYRGTVRKEGFWWTNPFTVRRNVSLKAHNIASEKIKVNDLLGNPLEIGAVVVWQVRDTAQAVFDVEDYEDYVDVQIETAVREIAKRHPYDDGQAEVEVVSLRGDTSVVTDELESELHTRLERAGIAVVEARLSHLAYAAEIASAMLQRQQAVAVIAARKQIVEGAVSMVEQALADLGEKRVVDLDDAQRAELVGDLLVVLCGQTAPQPVLQTGR